LLTVKFFYVNLLIDFSQSDNLFRP